MATGPALEIDAGGNGREAAVRETPSMIVHSTDDEVAFHPRSDEAETVREWRAHQLHRLGVPQLIAELFAETVDWHELARLTGAGCPPLLALEIVR